jgi:predicted MFS family arabinose efflux permease
MGIFAFGNVPGLQVYVVQKAEQYTPGAVDGLRPEYRRQRWHCAGVVIGGQTVERYGLAQTPWIGRDCAGRAAAGGAERSSR